MITSARRPTVLMAAGEWGYGPIVTAEMIVRGISAFADVHLIASGVAAAYASNSPVLGVCERRSVDSLETDYDLVVSVLEPASLIWAFQQRVRAVSVDNIYWHWHWPDHLATDAQAILAAATTDVAATLAALEALGGYAEYTPLYLATDQVIWQQVGPPVVTLPAGFLSKVTRVEPLLRQLQPTPKRRQLLLSLSGGLLNPMTDKRHWKTYLDVLAGVSARGVAVARAAGWNVVVAAPAPLQEMATTAFGVPAKSFGHGAFLRVLTESAVVAAPKGLSTTVEAVAYGAALFTMPELHDGNAINYWGLCEAVGYEASDFAEIFPAAQLTTSAEEAPTIAALYSAYERELFPGGAFVNRSAKTFATFIEACVIEPRRLEIAEGQYAALLRAANGFDGVNQVVDILRSALVLSDASALSVERCESA